MVNEYSVVINCLNGADTLEHCLRSISQQTLKPKQIVFVDNASSDRSLEIFESVVGEFRFNFSLTAIRLAAIKNLGYVRSLAIRLTSFNFVMFCDVDDQWFPNKAESQMLAASKCGASVIACGHIPINNLEIINPRKINGPLNATKLFKIHPFEIIFKNNIAMSAIFINKEIFFQSGNDIKSFLTYCPDYAFLLHAAYDGSLVFDKNKLVFVLKHDNQFSYKVGLERFTESNQVLDAFKRSLGRGKFSFVLRALVSFKKSDLYLKYKLGKLFK